MRRQTGRPVPCGVRDVDAAQVDALAAHDEEGGEAEQRDPAADHGQLGRLPRPQLQLLNDVAAQHDAHSCTGHDDHTYRQVDRERDRERERERKKEM